MTTESTLRTWFVEGRLRGIGRPVYAWTTAAQLALHRALDAIRPGESSADIAQVTEHLTAVIKTFERPHALRRLVDSIRRSWPGLRIVIADDSRSPARLSGTDHVILPYDTGVGAGRNVALERVTTRYLLTLDDDFVLLRSSGLAAAVRLMDAHERIDILGGRVIYLPTYRTHDYRRAMLFPTRAEPTMPPASTIGGLPVYDKVAQFFVARTERVRLVGWNSRLKRRDHADFFTRAMGRLTTVYDERMKCLHVPTPFDDAYMDKRRDFAADVSVLQGLYGTAVPAPYRRP